MSDDPLRPPRYSDDPSTFSEPVLTVVSPTEEPPETEEEPVPHASPPEPDIPETNPRLKPPPADETDPRVRPDGSYMTKGPPIKAKHRMRPHIQDEVERLLSSLVPPRPIMKMLSKKFSVPEHVAKRWIREVYAVWAGEGPTVDREARREQMRNSLSVLYNKSVATGTSAGFATATQVLDRLCKLDGLYAPEVNEAASESVVSSDPDRIRERLAAIVEKHPALRDRILKGSKK